MPKLIKKVFFYSSILIVGLYFIYFFIIPVVVVPCGCTLIDKLTGLLLDTAPPLVVGFLLASIIKIKKEVD